MSARRGEPGESGEPRITPRGRAPIVITTGVGLVGLGTALAIAGILVPNLFRPGTIVIGAGMLVLGVGGALLAVRRDA